MTAVDALLLAGRLLLAGVFVLAGIAKLRDRAGSRRALIDFGVPGALATPGGILLPLAELAVAVALIPTASARYGALAALALLLLFLAGIGRSLARGRRPDCHCFGQLYSGPVGWRTLVRNGLLAAVAAFVAVVGWRDAGPSVVAWLGPLTAFERAAVLGGALAIALLGMQSGLLIALFRQNQRMLRHLTAPAAMPTADAMSAFTAAPVVGLPVGALAPSFALPTLDGDALTLDGLRARGKPVALLFSDPGCGPCNALLPEIGRWQAELDGDLTVALLSRDSVEANRAKGSEHGLRRVLLQRDREVAEAYAIWGTPSAVLVRPDGTIGSAAAQGAEEIRQLIAQSSYQATIGRTQFPTEPPVVALSPDAKPLPEHCVRDELMEDGAIVLHHTCRQQTMTLNPTAALIWACCDGDHTIGDIVAELRDVFPDMPDAERDVRDLLTALVQAQMIAPPSV